MQVILQATHGIVSGAPDFFKQAFGDTAKQFDELMLRPHHMIFNRMWFERGAGRAEFEEYESALSRLSIDERREMLEVLSTVLFDLPERPRMSRKELYSFFESNPNGNLRSALRFHVPPTKDEERKIWTAQREVRELKFDISDDIIVEDAGLDDSDSSARLESKVA
jgi:hypothetical protein